MAVFKKSWEKGDYEIHCEKRDDGTGYCKVEEIDGDGWAKIHKTPTKDGELETGNIDASPNRMADIAQKMASKYLSSKSKPR